MYEKILSFVCIRKCGHSSVCVCRCVSLLKVHVWIFEGLAGDI